MLVSKVVEECIHSCDFFSTSMDGMECNHPYFKDKHNYANMIISQADRGKIPYYCPLRKESLTVEYNI